MSKTPRVAKVLHWPDDHDKRRAGFVHPFDEKNGTDTSGLIPGSELVSGSTSDRFTTAYYAVAPSIFEALLEIWQRRCAPPFPFDSYTFVDVGAGKGRATLMAARNPFASVWAVELQQRLAEVARRNLEKMSGESLSPVCVITDDALTLTWPTTPTLFFLFHPFEAPAVRRFLRQIGKQFQDRPYEADILYVNAEHRLLFDDSGLFQQLWMGRVPMSAADHVADLKEIELHTNYGSTGDELCAIYRYSKHGAATSRRTVRY